jgi:hypothetical protein
MGALGSGRGVYLVVACALIVFMITTGHVDDLILYGLGWAIMMPVSLVILIASMFIASAIAGGIDFGDARWAIPKGLFLLAPICLINVIFSWRLGLLLSIPFWIGGLMLLFGLDVWEAKFMILINVALATVAKILIFLIVIAMLHGAEMEREKESPDDSGDDALVVPQKDPPKTKLRLRR